MPDYQKSKIYKLVSLVSNEIYIGSTIKSLSLRKGQHISTYKRWLLEKKNNVCCSYKLLEKGDVDIILIENYPCNNKEELNIRERFYIENSECINVRLPIITKIEKSERQKKYWNENYEYFKEWKKNDKLIDPNKYKQINKSYYNKVKDNRFICECGANIKFLEKSRHFTTVKHKQYILSKNN
jgi:hypothetical protein